MAARFLGVLAALALAWSAQAQVSLQGKARNTATWPCRSVKVPEISLPAVWPGPPISHIQPAAWLNDPVVSAMAARLAARRTPLEEALALAVEFGNAAGPAKRERLLTLFAALFSTLARERGEVIAGLERFGSRQKELADQIRAQTANMRELQDQPATEPKKLEDVTTQLAWDMRIFEDKRKSVSFVCETPVLIEQRLFALGRAIAAELE